MEKTNDLKIKDLSFEEFLNRYLSYSHRNGTGPIIGGETIVVKKSVLEIITGDPYISFYRTNTADNVPGKPVFETRFQYQIDTYDDISVTLTLVDTETAIVKTKSINN